MKVYLCGAMRGHAGYRFAEFDEAARVLRKAGHEVISPAELDRERGFDPSKLLPDHDWTSIPSNFDMQTCIMDDIKAILACDAVAVLPKSDKSVGVKAEVAVATWAGKHICDYADGRLWARLTNVPSCITQRVHVSMNAAYEHIVRDSVTGGCKGTKLERPDLVPWQAEKALAEHYGKCGGNGTPGTEKYEPNNWRKGYAWSLSYGAARRHLLAWWGGEDIDASSGSHHLIAAAWHCFTAYTFSVMGLGTDDRPKEG